ncbi:hypothetical protein BVX93_01225 [bacterium B13(2017)]|nr:hypothetical protein BVX93_01225 [bacterium B13(2017)]
MFNKRQYNILSERYFECLLGDFGAFLWMLGQAPLIALVIILRWKSWQATESLYFVMSLSCVWFGCINACREIAKEKTIYKRERLFGLSINAYLASKIKILCIIGLIEIGIFYLLLKHYLHLDLQSFLAFVTLFGLYFSGLCLGLMLSRWCGTVAKAVVSVPIAIIPQIVFSKFVLPENSLKGIAIKIEKLMVVKWGFEALNNCKKAEVVFKDYSINMLYLMGLAILFIFITLIHLWMVDDD